MFASQPGSIIGAGDLLATMELKDPSKVKKILPFTGSLKLSDSKSQLDDPFQQLSLIMEGIAYTHARLSFQVPGPGCCS